MCGGGTRWYLVVPGGTLVFIGWYPSPRLGFIIIIMVGVGGRRYGVAAPNLKSLKKVKHLSNSIKIL